VSAFSDMHDFFSRLAKNAATVVAHPAAFLAAIVVVLVWALAGPLLHFSESWQLIINTGTTILTFLMVFLLQNTQNRESRAMQVKLDELLRAISGARTELVDLENVSEAELARYCEEFKQLHLQYAKLLATRKSGRRMVAGTASGENTAELVKVPAITPRSRAQGRRKRSLAAASPN
jgi:low affinity Fe/Cu permease